MVKRPKILLLLGSLALILPLALAFESYAQQSEAARTLFKETKAKADKGDAECQYALGGFYTSGFGVPADLSKAVKSYRKAAEQGHAQAQFQLGVSYAQGLGVKRDVDEAAHWFRQAAEQGLADAQVEAGRCFLTGKGVSTSGVEALRWFRKASAQGSIAADYYIGRCYFDGAGVPRDIEAGLKWTRRAAEAGYPAAQNSLGSCYEKGTGVARDHLQAYKWYALAAAQDDANAPDIQVSMARVESFLSKEQVTEAQRLAREFQPKLPGNGAEAAKSAQGNQAEPATMADFGLVTVTGGERGLEVFVDGAFVGNTPAKLKLKEGPHVIEVKRSGFKPFQREIKLSAGSELTLDAVLEKE